MFLKNFCISSHSYISTGSTSYGAYQCDGNALRIGSCSSSAGSVEITLQVEPNVDFIGIETRIAIQGSYKKIKIKYFFVRLHHVDYKNLCTGFKNI